MKKLLLIISGVLFLVGAKLLGGQVLTGGLLVMLMAVIFFATAIIIHSLDGKNQNQPERDSLLLAWFPNFKNTAPMKRGDYWILNVGAVVFMAVMALPVGYLCFELLGKGNDLIASILSMLAVIGIYTRIAGHGFNARMLDANLNPDLFSTVGYATLYLAVIGVVSDSNPVTGIALFVQASLFMWVGFAPSSSIIQQQSNFQSDQRISQPNL